MNKLFKIASLRTLSFALFMMIVNVSFSQTCDAPSNTSTNNILNFSATLNWDADSNAHHYRLRYREVGSSAWSYNHNIVADSSYNLTGLSSLINYEWQLKTFCSSGNSPSSSWSFIQTFTTANFPVDCNNTPNGTAWTDSCGNCVGGNTGNVPCISFSPTVSMSLSRNECDSLADFTFSFSQDPNEPDVASAVFSSDGGSFDFTGLSPNDTVGSSVNTAAGGQINVTTTLLVDFIISSNKISIKSIDNITGQLY